MLVPALWDRIAARCGFEVVHLLHPSFDRETVAAERNTDGLFFFHQDIRTELPSPDRALLLSMERAGVPTIHNMIMSDRVVRRLRYEEALSYATLLTRRLIEVYRETSPSVIIGGFDALHGSLGLAVARHLNIPWYAMYFPGLPTGHVALCSDMSPSSLTALESRREEELLPLASMLLQQFESRKAQAAAYVPPRILSPSFILRQIPSQLRSLLTVLRRRRLRRYLQYTNYANSYSVAAQFTEALRLRRNLWQLRRQRLRTAAPLERYAFFGLHMQPESSIDVFAHFFANQTHVIELMARSLPPTHKLLVKLHKSDPLNYSSARLDEWRQFPGVDLVSPWADTHELISKADLVFSIQGTIGLEAALLGRPVIMFGDSPYKGFPSVSTLGRTIDLPQLVRDKLLETTPQRPQIVRAFAAYLSLFYAASANDWTVRPSDQEIDGFATLFQVLARKLLPSAPSRAQSQVLQ